VIDVNQPPKNMTMCGPATSRPQQIKSNDKRATHQTWDKQIRKHVCGKDRHIHKDGLSGVGKELVNLVQPVIYVEEQEGSNNKQDKKKNEQHDKTLWLV
jgi:hypothetical protein